MRILITGANGYIGSTLAKALNTKYDVMSITRHVVELTNSEDVSTFFKTAPYLDVVIHCAVVGGSRLHKDDWTVLDKNLLMYYNLLGNRSAFGRLIHFGSGAETYMPKEPYGYSKRVIAKSILTQDNFYNIKIFGVFDENELSTRFIKANIKRYINREPLSIHQDKLMDFFYMQDLIKVVEYYINEDDPPKEFDCVYGPAAPTLSNVAAKINTLEDYEVPVIYGTEGFDVYASQYRTVELPIEYVGLMAGIRNTYNKLKNETN